jgi:DNA-binding response OmpR family regulator
LISQGLYEKLKKGSLKTIRVLGTRTFGNRFTSKELFAMEKKILIVEDEPNIVVPLQFIMKENGYDVTVAFSGEEAVEAISRIKPDLILLDIMLPGMDGYELCQTIRQKPEWEKIKIIFLTALGREADMAKGMALEADAYITKPFSNKEVIEKVRELLKN